MDDHLLFVLKIELKSQLENAAIAEDDFRAAKTEDELWYALQNLLVVAGNISKLLWGSRGPEGEAARKPLRDLAGVTDDSPLRDRKVGEMPLSISTNASKTGSTPGTHPFIRRGDLAPPTN